VFVCIYQRASILTRAEDRRRRGNILREVKNDVTSTKIKIQRIQQRTARKGSGEQNSGLLSLSKGKRRRRRSECETEP